MGAASAGCGLSRLLRRHVGAQPTEEAWTHVPAISPHKVREVGAITRALSPKMQALPWEVVARPSKLLLEETSLWQREGMQALEEGDAWPQARPGGSGAWQGPHGLCSSYLLTGNSKRAQRVFLFTAHLSVTERFAHLSTRAPDQLDLVLFFSGLLDGFPGGARGKEPSNRCRRCRFSP